MFRPTTERIKLSTVWQSTTFLGRLFHQSLKPAAGNMCPTYFCQWWQHEIPRRLQWYQAFTLLTSRDHTALALCWRGKWRHCCLLCRLYNFWCCWRWYSCNKINRQLTINFFCNMSSVIVRAALKQHYSFHYVKSFRSILGQHWLFSMHSALKVILIGSLHT